MTRPEAERIVDALLYNLNDRRGFRLSTLDEDTRTELRETWIALVMAGGDGRQPWWVRSADGGAREG